MEKIQLGLQIVGAFSTVFTCLHLLFPKVAVFEKLGVALGSLFGKPNV